MATEDGTTMYDRVGLEPMDRYMRLSEFNKEQLRLISEGLNPCETILDLGIGLGNLAEIFIESGKTVYGVDIRQDSLDYVRKKITGQGKGKLHLVLKDVHELGYNEEFDGACCVSNLTFFENLGRVFTGVHRALKSDGCFAMSGMERTQMKKWFELHNKEVEKYCKEGKLTFSPDEVERLAMEKKNVADMVNKSVDSSERTIGTLQQNGFNILRNEPFYHDTCYYVLAQKI